MGNHAIMKRRIGILGGTFDPVHLGHIALAIVLSEAHHLDRVLFVPAALNPTKHHLHVTEAKHRLAMLKIALRHVPRCTVVTTELERSGPSYMIDTILQLQQERSYRGAELFLLMGEDLVEHFPSWRAAHELVRLCQPLIAKRGRGVLQGNWQQDKEICAAIERGITATPLFDMSATEIRQRLRAGLFCGHLLHHGVLRYIKKNNLYL
jgi:nicotinate-nucleotide adenylyltransferase